jgi:hypothetical protein
MDVKTVMMETDALKTLKLKKSQETIDDFKPM